MKKTKNKLLIFLCLVILILLTNIGVYIHIYNNTSGIELTQLQANAHCQMMGYIIKTKQNEVIVIDGGTTEDTTNLLKHINDLGGTVDYWFITHPHVDHMGALYQLVKENENINIKKLYYTMNDLDWYNQYGGPRAYEAGDFAYILESNSLKDIAEEVSLGQIIQIDNVKCEILGIKNPEITTNAINNSSMVMKMYINNKSILFLGDIGIEAEEKLIYNYKDKLKSDIVQISHHGQLGADEKLYKLINPEICLWPTAEWLWNNDDGDGENTGPWHTFETREWIENLNVKQNIIQKDGDITIKIK